MASFPRLLPRSQVGELAVAASRYAEGTSFFRGMLRGSFLSRYLRVHLRAYLVWRVLYLEYLNQLKSKSWSGWRVGADKKWLSIPNWQSWGEPCLLCPSAGSSMSRPPTVLRRNPYLLVSGFNTPPYLLGVPLDVLIAGHLGKPHLPSTFRATKPHLGGGSTIHL